MMDSRGAKHLVDTYKGFADTLKKAIKKGGDNVNEYKKTLEFVSGHLHHAEIVLEAFEFIENTPKTTAKQEDKKEKPKKEEPKKEVKELSIDDLF